MKVNHNIAFFLFVSIFTNCHQKSILQNKLPLNEKNCSIQIENDPKTVSVNCKKYSIELFNDVDTNIILIITNLSDLNLNFDTLNQTNIFCRLNNISKDSITFEDISFAKEKLDPSKYICYSQFRLHNYGNELLLEPFYISLKKGEKIKISLNPPMKLVYLKEFEFYYFYTDNECKNNFQDFKIDKHTW